MGRLVVNANTALSMDKNFVYAIEGDSSGDVGLLTANFLPGIGYGITNFLDFSFVMPVYWDDISPEQNDRFGLTGSFGDLEISGKFQYPPYPHSTIFEVAFFGGLSLPTGSRKDGWIPRHTYYFRETESDTGEVASMFTSEATELDLKMLWTLDLNQFERKAPLQLHLNFGARFTFHNALDNLFLLNLGFEYHPVEWFGMFTGFSGETKVGNVKDGFRLGEDPLRLSPGISITPPGGFYINLGGDINLSADSTHNTYMVDGSLIETRVEPRWRINVTIGWCGFILPQDEDKDGIKDNIDRCPKDPEDFDGYEDTDGCPDLDNDVDGIPDVDDKCPADPEDKDGFEDEDGCPDLDNDKDGIPDLDDKCPLVPEDVDGFEDEDGCADFDNDMDGVPDTSDQCMTEPEDRDGFMDHDGCPDFDNDQDGVPDSVDKCPDTKGVPENNGCPMEKPKPKEIKRGRVVLRGVNFEFGSAVLTGDSYAILEKVYESLKEWPEIRIEIR
ncbi:MAG: hypothetical protein GF350_02155, partial [Chitinivibrionales bacterium]|nr:hypothetical protein [Chitinivibrionales bacterium]